MLPLRGANRPMMGKDIPSKAERKATLAMLMQMAESLGIGWEEYCKDSPMDDPTHVPMETQGIQPVYKPLTNQTFRIEECLWCSQRFEVEII